MTYVLITNDDGIDAPGIRSLAMAMQAMVDKVRIVAPATNQSMSGHKITMFQDIQVEERTLLDIPSKAVHGSPADCISLAALGVVDWPPRLVVSGINRGANMGQDTFYSGTVSAALEATIQGIPALAVSLDDPTADNVEAYEIAGRLAARVVARMIENGLPEFTLLNLNVPSGQDVKGMRLTKQGVRIYRDELITSADGRTVQVAGEAPTGRTDELGTDLWAVHNGYASLTPLQIDLTAHDFLADLAAWDVST